MDRLLPDAHYAVAPNETTVECETCRGAYYPEDMACAGHKSPALCNPCATALVAAYHAEHPPN